MKLQKKKNCTPHIKERYRNDRATGNFLDAIGKVTMDSLQKDFANVQYFCILSDGNTDSSVIERMCIFIIFKKWETTFEVFVD